MQGQVCIDIFVDGISPYDSVRQTVVALAGCVGGQKKPFVIALWCGKIHEPDNVDLFFKDFIDDAKNLMENGFVIDGGQGSFFLIIEKVIGDALARAWCLRTVIPPHAFYCCERCVSSYVFLKAVIFYLFIEVLVPPPPGQVTFFITDNNCECS